MGHTLGKRGIFAHRDPNVLDPHFRAETQGPKTRHQGWLERFDLQETRSQEAFARHFRAKYGPHLPVWVATEVMSFGVLAQLFNGAAQDDRNRTAASLDLMGHDGRGDAALLSNWMNHIRYIRNICAHHSRVWNRSFDVELASAAHIADLAHLTSKSRRRLYGTISVLAFLLARTAPESDWRLRIRSLIEARNAATRDLLHSRETKDRRSWLNYLKSRHALVWVSMGTTNLFPAFQLDPASGDIRPMVGNINADLYSRLVLAGMQDDDARWRMLEWWITPTLQGADTPMDRLLAGTLTVELARTTYPHRER